MNNEDERERANKRVAKNLLAASLIWLLLVALTVFFDAELSASLSLLAILWWLALYAAGIF